MRQQTLGSGLRAWPAALAAGLNLVRARWLVGAVGIGIALASWPVPAVGPSPGMDPSLVAALHVAAERGMDVGTQVVTTYGPLGFLAFPTPIYGPTSALALAYTLGIHLALVAIIVSRAFTIYPWWAAVPVAYVGAQAIRWLGIPEVALALATIAAILTIGRAAGGRPMPSWALIVAGFIVAATSLGKINTGPVVLAISIIGVLVAGGRRGLALFGASTLVSSGALWIASGQGIGNVIAFIDTSVSIALGFTAAMGLDQDPTVHWMVPAGVAATAVVVGALVTPRAGWSRRHIVGVILVGALAGYVTYKASYVRWHFMFIFATLVIVSVALAHRSVARRMALIATAVPLIALLAATRTGPLQYLDPSPISALNQMRSALFYDASATDNRARLANAYNLPEALVSRISGGGVHVGPFETGVVFAYPALGWAPLPVYQDYMAYTASLDDLNRRSLLGEAAPRWMLRQTPRTIDGRNSWFDGPSSMRAMLCRYHEVAVAGDWILLERGRSQCGEERLVATVTVAPGETTEVPPLADGDVMSFVRIHGLEPGPGEQVRSFLFKAPEWYVILEGTWFRLVAPTAGEGLLMAVDDEIDYTVNFGFGSPHRSISVARGPRSEAASSSLVLEFWAVAAAKAEDTGSP